MPLGGLGEIGMNCFALEQEGKVLVVDCGATFPDDDIGVDLLVPDFAWLRQRKEDIVGLFVTHGHEDHIGAIPHFLRVVSREIPIFAPPHASALIAERLSDQELHGVDLRVVETRNAYQIGPFSVEPIAVAHSIVDATALCIETSVGRIVHTADFDLDDEQPAGYLTDAHRLSELGDSGVRLLLSDSTNVEVAERGLSEGDVGRALFEEIQRQDKRVVVAMFASNGHRLQGILDAAVRTDRKVCLLGRSLLRHLRVSTDLGYLKYPSNLLVAPERLADLERERTLIIAGGSQGEAASSLRRLSLGLHGAIELEEGDSVILSARVIPGNEVAVFTMICDFARKGISVITRRENPAVHTSGHAASSELSQMLEWIRPASFIPVHGTLHHLRKHEALARSLGVTDVQVVEDGTGVRIPPTGPLEPQPGFPQTPVRITFGGQVLETRQRRRRSDLARRGVVVVSVRVDERGCAVKVPVVTTSGVAGVDDDVGAHSVLSASVREALRLASAQRMSSTEQIVQRCLRQVILEMCGEKPVIFVHILVDE